MMLISYRCVPSALCPAELRWAVKPSQLSLPTLLLTFVSSAQAGCPEDKVCGLEGKSPISFVEQRSQLSLWAILASPIIIGSDLRSASQAAFQLLGQVDMLKISQDVAGVQGWRVDDGTTDGEQIWARPLGHTAPVARRTGSFAETTEAAVALLNTDGVQRNITLDMSAQLDWSGTDPIVLLNVWSEGRNVTVSSREYTVLVGAHDTALLHLWRGDHR